ncbi:hypothetical protein VC83_07765 [Pseudogymnoascus destructans]|uniref:Uncharacterized protein n=2 Tax=Pseudogymnoascus destructans TaxID=655981 RepID=L8FP84_PSED2|nr:uncharacterized protein VC83_07765 [Pseudogymnoascus destructans]ELR02364.1 hypothetical protein GMDG_05428 [Pseudogymnoascus destructans 20631-21]OAF55778.1 hypothetical protein VC83_07765 [Pseudogymnoascus destructans]
MFDLPDAKRVRRDDLYNSDDGNEDAASPIDDSRAKLLQDQLAQLYGPITISSQDPVAPGGTEFSPDAPPAEAEDEEFEFRLFAPSTTAVASNGNQSQSSKPDETATQRIILSNSDDEDLGDGAFTVPHRRLSWYIAAPATGTKKAGFEEAAVSADMVQREREHRAWALEKPWRVTVIRTGSTSTSQPEAALAAKSVSVRTAEGDGKTKRSKPNKKRRIEVRVRERALAEKLEAERLRCARMEEEKASRGADDAQKRTARNRERKVKRREREKRKKAAAAAGMPEPSGEADSGSGSDAN